MCKVLYRCLLMASCTCLAGCLIPAPWPGKAETSPEIRGHIADARTKQPIADARVQIHERPKVATVSNSAGDFCLPQARHFYLMRFLSPGDVYYVPSVPSKTFKIDITHPDYQPLSLDAFWEWQLWDSPRTNPVPKGIVIRDALLTPRNK
jgi:hypothetical protein